MRFYFAALTSRFSNSYARSKSLAHGVCPRESSLMKKKTFYSMRYFLSKEPRNQGNNPEFPDSLDQNKNQNLKKLWRKKHGRRWCRCSSAYSPHWPLHSAWRVVWRKEKKRKWVLKRKSPPSDDLTGVCLLRLKGLLLNSSLCGG